MHGKREKASNPVLRKEVFRAVLMELWVRFERVCGTFSMESKVDYWQLTGILILIVTAVVMSAMGAAIYGFICL